MRKFIKKAELQLVNGGYVSDKDGNPVSNGAFIAAQKRAEYVITFASLAKGKDFVGKQADSIQDLRAEVSKKLESTKPSYLEAPKKVVKKLSEQLAEEALSFMKYTEDVSKVEKINNFLQEFNILSEFEEFGLFFEDDIVKLNKIYSMSDVVNAVKEVIELLEK